MASLLPCGIDSCRLCHPVPVPEEPHETLPQLIAGVVGLLLVAVALLFMLPAVAA